MTIEFANKCKFDNPELHKPHGKRALGITLLQNSSLSEQGKLKAARHSDMKSHVQYQCDTNENLEKKYEALNPSLISKDSSSILSTSSSTSCTKPTLSPSTQNVTNQNPNPSFSYPPSTLHYPNPNNQNTFSYPQPYFQPQPQQVVISIQQPSPYPINMPPNPYFQNLPSSNFHHQSMPPSQNHNLHQSPSNSESDFMARLVKHVTNEIKKK